MTNKQENLPVSAHAEKHFSITRYPKTAHVARMISGLLRFDGQHGIEVRKPNDIIRPLALPIVTKGVFRNRALPWATSLRDVTDRIVAAQRTLEMPCDVLFGSYTTMTVKSLRAAHTFVVAQPSGPSLEHLQAERSTAYRVIEDILGGNYQKPYASSRPADMTLAFVPHGTPSNVVERIEYEIGQLGPEMVQFQEATFG